MSITAYEVWIDLLRTLLQAGNQASPRGKPIKELIGVNLLISNAYANIIYHPLRKLNYRFLVAQWLTTLLGLEDRPILDKFNSHLSDYEEDGRGGRYPSYGPKLKTQWMFIIKSIREDPETRQAVMSIWEPPIKHKPECNLNQTEAYHAARQALADMPPEARATEADREANAQAELELEEKAQLCTCLRDVPCTLALQFLPRGGYLHTIVTMRSSDAWLGLPYDIFNFTMLANHLAAALSQAKRRRILLGTITLNLGSSHLYEENWTQAQQVVSDASIGIGKTIISPPLPSGFELPPLRPFLEGMGGVFAIDLPIPWRQYAAALASDTSAEALEFLEFLEDYYATKIS
jgi:thymidylate synthase